MAHYESPDYQLIKKEEPFELRKYHSFYLMTYDNETDSEMEKFYNAPFTPGIFRRNEIMIKVSM